MLFLFLVLMGLEDTGNFGFSGRFGMRVEALTLLKLLFLVLLVVGGVIFGLFFLDFLGVLTEETCLSSVMLV